MAQQEEGWPLGLRLFNSRIGFLRNGDFSGSFSTVFSSASSIPATDYSSSDLDTESSGSFFHDKSITLGSLVRISSFLELSRRPNTGRVTDTSKENKKNHKLKPWFFSLCSKLSTDAVSGSDAYSLGHYLEAERRAASTFRRNQFPRAYRPNGYSSIQNTNSGEEGELDHQQNIGFLS